MKYDDSIREINSRNHNKTANEDICRIMDALQGNEEAMASLLNLTIKWESKCREVFGLRKSLENKNERYDRRKYY